MLFPALFPRLQELVIRRDLLGVAFFVAAALSGKLAATKLLGNVFPPWLLEVRLWMTVAAVCLFLPFAGSMRWNRFNTYLLGSISVLVIYLLVRAPFGATDLTAPKVVDLVYLIVLCYLVLIVASDTARLAACGALILIATGVLFILALTGVATNPELNGAGWAAIGGPLTFYRLEFLGFSCTLWMILRNKGHLVVETLLLSGFLFATLASLSKAAYGATAIVLLVLAAGLITQRNWRILATLASISLVVFVAWHSFLSNNFYTRANSAFVSQQPEPTPEDFAELKKRFQLPSTDTDTYRAAGSGNTQPQLDKQIPLNKDSFLAPGFNFLTEFRWCALDDSDGNQKAKLTCHEKTMIDRTQRLFFLFKALEAPSLFGHGLASFRVLALNPGAGYRLEQYSYPHDVIVELLYDAGVVGLGLFVVALTFSVAGFFRFIHRDPALLALGGFCLFIFISALAAGDFYDFRLFWLVALTWSTYPNLYQTKDGTHTSCS